MAHAGHAYPVHFRRDYNLNVTTYAHGLPRGWNADFGDLLGSLGLYLNTHLVFCQAHFERVLPAPDWESEKQTGGGRTFFITVHSEMTGDHQQLAIVGEIIDSSKGIVAKFRSVQVSLGFYSLYNGSFDTSFNPEPSIVQARVGSRANFLAAPWSYF